MCNRTRKRDQAVEPFADFLHQREGAQHAGMTAGAGGHGDQAGGALFDCLACETVVDHVVKRNAAPAFDRAEHFLARSERGDDQRHLPFCTGRHVGFEPVVRFVDDLVDRIGGCRTIGIIAVVRRQLFGDLVQPLIHLALRTRVERGKTADDPRLALRDDQFGPGNDEQRRSDDGEAQLVEGGGQGHGGKIPLNRR